MDWSFRLTQEVKKCFTAHFLTMTYDDKYIPTNNSLLKEDVQLFTKRLRKGNSKIVPWPVRYYTVGEYGTETHRPHYHSIMFNIHDSVIRRVSDHWQLGNCYVGSVEVASINYVTKYVINRPGDYGTREPPFALMSRRPGIGSSYLDTHKMWHKDGLRNFTQVNGVISRLPRYYKEKFFTPEERTELATQAILLGDEKYQEDVKQLSKFHSDPYYYYDELIAYKHELVTSKLNSFNKF